MKHPLIAALFAVGVAACTTSSAMMVADDEAILSIQAHTTLVGADAVNNQALKEAAKTTVNRGYRYFEIEDSQDISRNISVLLPGYAQTYGNVATYGNSANYSGSTTYTPPHVMSGQWAGERMRIKMYKDGDMQAAQSGAYDAFAILGK